MMSEMMQTVTATISDRYPVMSQSREIIQPDTINIVE